MNGTINTVTGSDGGFYFADRIYGFVGYSLGVEGGFEG